MYSLKLTPQRSSSGSGGSEFVIAQSVTGVVKLWCVSLPCDRFSVFFTTSRGEYNGAAYMAVMSVHAGLFGGLYVECVVV